MRARVMLVVSSLVAAFALLTATQALAATPDEAATEVRRQGYYLEDPSLADGRRLGALAEEVARAGHRYVPVVLAERPGAGPTVFADGVLDRLGSGTVVVLAPGSLGYSSTEFSSEQLNAAGEVAVADFRREPVAGFATFARALVRPGATSRPRAGGGVGLLPLLLIIAIAVFAFRAFQRRDTEYVEEELTYDRVEDAKAEIGGQLRAIADGIVELSDRVAVGDSAEAKRHYRGASEVYATAEDELAAAATLQDLERLVLKLDRARWQIEAARALLEGRKPPAEPEDEPASCFFDPMHGAGVERIQVEGRRGTVSARICRTCADALRRGEPPQPRRVRVGGEEMPVAAAPAAFGGLGFGLLGPFGVLLPGVGMTMYGPFGGGMFGGGLFGGGLFGGGMFRGGFGSRSSGGFGAGRGRGGMGISRGRGGRSL